MKISTLLARIIIIIILLSGVSNIFLIRFQSQSLHQNSELLFSETITQSLSETLIRDVINGNKIRVSNELSKFVSRENPVDFLFIIDSNQEVFAHSFTAGFPRYLLNRNNYDQDIDQIRLINRYRSDNGLIHEYASPLLSGIEFILHIGVNQSHYTETLYQNNRNIILVSALLLIVSLVLAYRGSRSIIKPLRNFTQLVDKYGRGKKVKVEVEQSSPQEILNLNNVLTQAIEKRYEAERLLSHQANYDALTNLPNRYFSEAHLGQLLTDAPRQMNKVVAVVFLDLDDFKRVNDSLGHEVGDKVLVSIADRLNGKLGSNDMVGRLGGDEFIGIFADLESREDAQPLMEKLLSSFHEPVEVYGKVFYISASAGVAFFPSDGEQESDLLVKADTAMYHAKANGKNTYSFHSNEMYQAVRRRREIEESLFDALDQNEFQVFYQPKHLVESREVTGFEALLRWENPRLGCVSPEEFIPVAEQTGLIISIGRYVIRAAIEFISALNQHNSTALSIAVNLSPTQFRDPELVQYIKKQLEEFILDVGLFEIEITENVLLQESSLVNLVLDEFHRQRIKIAMDDFGTGYSSLSYIRQFPFDSIKIDRSFIMEMEQNQSDHELVSASILMAHALDLNVVAEGVESDFQLEFLRQHGCDVAQGYFFSKPLPMEEVASYLSSCLNT